MSYRGNSFQAPSHFVQRQPSVPEEGLFGMDGMDIYMSTSPASVHSDNTLQERINNSILSMTEAPFVYPYIQQFQSSQAPKQAEPFTFESPTRAIPIVTNNTSLLSQRFLSQPPIKQQEYPNTVAINTGTNNFSYGNSHGHMIGSPIHDNFMGINLQDQDLYSLKPDDDFDLALLSPVQSSPLASNWPIDRSQPVGIPTGKSHSRTSSMSGSSRGHPYMRPGSLSNGTMLSPASPTPVSLLDSGSTTILPHQQAAVQNVYNFMREHPRVAIPATYFTSELAEVYESRGWCLVGICGHERAAQKLKPNYNPAKDSTRKRLDHLYDHIRDKHFENRPFQCAITPHTCQQAFTREHDLKRHEATHQPVSLPCDYCEKVYTRNDNLKRHVQLKHSGISLFSLPQMSRMTSSGSFHYGPPA